MEQPVDYLAAMGGVQNLVNPSDAIARGLVNQIEPQRMQLQMQAVQQKLAAEQEKAAREASFGSDVQNYLANPSTKGMVGLLGKYPELHDQIKTAHGALEADNQKALTSHLSMVGALAAKGDYAGAADLVEKWGEADKAAGLDASVDDLLAQHLRDPDPAKQKAALGMIAGVLGGIVGPEHAAEYLKVNGMSSEPYTLNQGDSRFNGQNELVASVAPKPDYLVIPEGGKAIPVGPGGPQAGGTIQGNPSGPAPSVGAVSGGRLDPHTFFHDFVLPHEGGYAAHDANGAPVNHGINQSANPGVNVADLSADQAADIFANKYFKASGADRLPAPMAAVVADTAFINPARAKQFLAASGGDPQKYMDLRQAWMNSLVAKDPAKYGKYQQAWSTRNRDLRAYAAQAGGGQPSGSDGATGPQPGDPAGTLYGNKKPGYTQLTPEQAEGRGLNPAKSWVVSPDGKPEAVGDAPAGGTDSIPGDITKTGDAYLATVPPNLRTQVKALSEGRLPLPSSFAMSKPYWQKMLQMTAQYDPTFDAANAKTRQKTRLEFTSGKAAQNITSFNTVLGHMDSLDRSIDDLHNTRFPTYNALANWAGSHAGDTRLQTSLATFNANRTAVARELTRAFRQSGGNVADIKDFEHDLGDAASPQALHAVVRKYADLLASRVSALGEQYNAGMGRSSDPINLLDPHAKQVMHRLLGEAGGEANGQPATHKALPPGAHQVGTYQGKPVFQYRDRNGQVHRLVSQ